MNRHFKSLIAASAVAAVACMAGNASAGTSDENGCAAAIGKNIAKYAATIAKNQVGCTKAKAGGKLANVALDCTDANDSDTKAKVPGARQKVIDGIIGKCDTGVPAETAAVLANYPICPSPSNINYPAAGGSAITTFTHVAKCLTGLVDFYVERMAEHAIGNVTNAVAATAIDANLAACQNGMGKAYSKYVKTYTGTYTKSQAAYSKANLTAGAALDYGVRLTGDPDGKAAAALTALNTAVSTSCAAVATPPQGATSKTTPSWYTIDTCGQDVAEQQACATSATTGSLKRQLSGLTGAIFQFPTSSPGQLQCASFADIVINAGVGDSVTNSRLDSGYTGGAHGVDIIDRSIGGVTLTNCDANCANCDVNIDPTNGYCRCANDSTITCDNPPNALGSVTATECGGNLCHCMFGPPLPLSATGNPVCVVNRFARSFTGGTTEVGSYNVGTRTSTQAYLGINQLRPCPTCVGDGDMNDGNKDGQCQYADEDPPTGTCDGNAVIALGGIENIVSFDCLPNSGGIGTLNLGLNFTDGTASMSNPFSGATRCNAGSCHCSQCTADATVGCNSNADCTAAGLGGSCGVDLVANNPRQNSCTAGVADCVADANSPGMGRCAGGPNDQFCQGALRGNGAGILPCSTNASCDVLDSECDGGDCGNCVAGLPGSQRSCFLPSISLTGETGVFDSEGVAAFCSAATGSGTINSATGLPGPARVRLDFAFDILCDNHSTTYELPGGMNCP